MDRAAFYGSIYSGDDQVVAAIFREWLKTDALDIKLRLGGVEIVYDYGLYLYSYNAAPQEGVPASFLIEGNTSGTLEQVRAQLQQLLQLCKERSLDANFEYVQIDAEGDELSDYFYVA